MQYSLKTPCPLRVDQTSYVASMDNAEMRTVGLVWSTLSGQGLFSEYCNVYAPYYRQADAGYIAGLSWEDAHTFWAYEASKDATQALDYYFEHWNKGKRCSKNELHFMTYARFVCDKWEKRKACPGTGSEHAQEIENRSNILRKGKKANVN